MDNEVVKKETTGSLLANDREVFVKDGKLTVVGCIALVLVLNNSLEWFFRNLNSN